MGNRVWMGLRLTRYRVRDRLEVLRAALVGFGQLLFSGQVEPIWYALRAPHKFVLVRVPLTIPQSTVFAAALRMDERIGERFHRRYGKKLATTIQWID